jgi:hypothetical protein
MRPESSEKDFKYNIKINGKEFTFKIDSDTGAFSDAKLGNQHISTEYGLELLDIINKYNIAMSLYEDQKKYKMKAVKPTVSSVLMDKIKFTKNIISASKDDSKAMRDKYIKELKTLERLHKDRNKIVFVEHPDRERILFCNIPDDKYMLDR